MRPAGRRGEDCCSGDCCKYVPACWVLHPAHAAHHRRSGQPPRTKNKCIQRIEESRGKIIVGNKIRNMDENELIRMKLIEIVFKIPFEDILMFKI